ncbi:MAG TPA: metal ABC transporter permease, partial [Pseudonocardiaceae bacterium]|nr:metal ABC transporter permease [Pseudonocardiaceae bacterium]
GACAAEATQAVGALLLLGLLAAPAGTAQRLTARPYAALGLSVVVALVDIWAGLGVSFAVPILPPSFAILAVATLCYVAAMVQQRLRSRSRRSLRRLDRTNQRITGAQIR